MSRNFCREEDDDDFAEALVVAVVAVVVLGSQHIQRLTIHVRHDDLRQELSRLCCFRVQRQ